MRNKIVHGICTAEGFHDLLYKRIGVSAYNHFTDTTLTVHGMSQAVRARNKIDIEPDAVFVSPLVRAIQTATLMFPNTQVVALECLKDYPQHTQNVNQRSRLSELKLMFPTVDFSELHVEHDGLFGIGCPHLTLSTQKIVARTMIRDSAFEKVALVTGSTWLHFFGTNNIDEHFKMKRCDPVQIYM
tara:strand:+ start:9174 stop:9731 length:558 start_codon:yes stop_codon:yes gene_type:complete